MIYKDRDELAVIQILEEKEEILFDEIETILMKMPATVIYIELRGWLYGIISKGDIEKAKGMGKEYVAINKNFAFVYRDESMRARQIFKDYDRINALPIINDDRGLEGEYVRWDDDVYNLSYSQFMIRNSHICRYFKTLDSVAIIRSYNITDGRGDYLKQWKNIIQGLGVGKVDIIDKEQLVTCIDRYNLFICMSEDEWNGITVLYNSIRSNLFLDSRFVVFRRIIDLSYYPVELLIANETGQKIRSDFFVKLQQQGICSFSYGIIENENGYLKRFNGMVKKKFEEFEKGKKTTILLSEMKKDFFGEIYEDKYEKSFFPLSYSIRREEGYFWIEDIEEEIIHIHNNERMTLEQPCDAERCVYMYGPCTILGVYVEDKHTVASWLQKKINDNGISCKVINYGNNIQSFLGELIQISKTSFKSGDIIFYYGGDDKNPNINLVDIYEKNEIPVNWVVDSMQHCNYQVNKIFADVIYEEILPVLNQKIYQREEVKSNDDYMTMNYLNTYFSEFEPETKGTIGAIVMNCNPFTLGHRYLIEEALNQVDFLIIFVVEEDKSLFSFVERFSMVYEGTKDLKNVMVVPSGKRILSQETFPEYFVKIVDEQIKSNVERDITIFASQIAPRLNITYRFVGEELEDDVTNEYNEAMKRILPSYGIKLLEIQRKKEGNGIISASRVRKYLEENNENNVNTLIPETTRRLLYR